MKLKLQIVRDEEILFEIPLIPMEWSKKQLKNEFRACEEDFQRISKIFDALSNQTRLRMMSRLIEEENHTMSFGDFMRDLNNAEKIFLNPKHTSDPINGGEK